MKKLLAILFAAASLISFAACGNKASGPETSVTSETTMAVEKTAEETSATVEETAQAVQATSAEETTKKSESLTEVQVLAKFNEFLAFAQEWNYNIDLYTKNITETPDDRYIYSEVKHEKFKTVASLKAEIGKYFEEGYVVSFFDDFVEKDGKLYFRFIASGYHPTRDIEDVRAKKNADGTFTVTYIETWWDLGVPLISEVTVYYKPNTNGDWYFYEGERNYDYNGASWQMVYSKYLKSHIGIEGGTFRPIYIDDDDIPELYIKLEDAYGYSVIVSYCNGGYNATELWGKDINYIEKGGIVCSKASAESRKETVQVYRLADGKFEGVLDVCLSDDGKCYAHYPDMNEINYIEYRRLVRENYPSNNLSSVYDEQADSYGYEITQENIDKYIINGGK